MGGDGPAEPSQCNPSRCAGPNPAEESQAKLSCAEACQAKKAWDGSKTTLFPIDLSIICPTGGGYQICYDLAKWISDRLSHGAVRLGSPVWAVSLRIAHLTLLSQFLVLNLPITAFPSISFALDRPHKKRCR